MTGDYSIVTHLRRDLAAAAIAVVTANPNDATEVGLAFLSGKPIVALTWGAQPLPERMVRAVDHVIHMDNLSITEAEEILLRIIDEMDGS